MFKTGVITLFLLIFITLLLLFGSVNKIIVFDCTLEIREMGDPLPLPPSPPPKALMDGTGKIFNDVFIKEMPSYI